MSLENERTLEFYNKHADLYCLRGKKYYAESQGIKDNGANCEFIRNSLNDLPQNAKMFEIGSGDGRDAGFINSLGYNIQTSDAVESFLSILRDKGFSPIKFNVVNDNFADSYDYILANAVFVHLTKPEVEEAVQKVYNALGINGRFVVSLRRRMEGEKDWRANIPGTSDGRFFSFWDISEAEKMLRNVGFKIIYFRQKDKPNACWLEFIAQK